MNLLLVKEREGQSSYYYKVTPTQEIRYERLSRVLLSFVVKVNAVLLGLGTKTRR